MHPPGLAQEGRRSFSEKKKGGGEGGSGGSGFVILCSQAQETGQKTKGTRDLKAGGTQVLGVHSPWPQGRTTAPSSGESNPTAKCPGLCARPRGKPEAQKNCNKTIWPQNLHSLSFSFQNSVPAPEPQFWNSWVGRILDIRGWAVSHPWPAHRTPAA